MTLAIGFITPAPICGWSLLAAPTNLHRSDFNTQYEGCLSTVAAARHTVEQAHVDATRRGGVPAAGPVPGLATAFDSLQTHCFDQKYLSALNQDRAQFDTVRAGALDAWRYASQPSSSGPAEQGPTREDQLTYSPSQFIDLVLLPHLHDINPPTVWDTVKGLLGQQN